MTGVLPLELWGWDGMILEWIPDAKGACHLGEISQTHYHSGLRKSHQMQGRCLVYMDRAHVN